MKLLKFDIMRPIGWGEERFVATLRYDYNPLWRFDARAFYAWVLEQRPTLQGKPINVYPEKPIMAGKGMRLTVMHFNQDNYGTERN